MAVTREKKKKSKARRIFGGIFYTLFCFVALALGSGAGWVNKSPVLVNILRENIRPSNPNDVFAKDSLTVLLLGCDKDLYYGGKQVLKQEARSDMMLVAKFDFKTNRVGGISIPRDLWCELPGYRGHKINAYHAMGGPELSKQAVEYMTGISIDRVLVLNFDAFQEMVDMVGGVEVFVPRDMKYTDRAGGLFIDLKKGRQKLDGYDAMCFVRFRKADSDFARTDRQRDFMLAFKQAIMGNPAQLPAVLEKASETIGNGLSETELATLSTFMRKVKSDNIKMGLLPVTEGSGTNLNLDVHKLDETLRMYYLKPGGYDATAMRSSGSSL
jgi:LCP family protein required for cell wall assembly